MSIIEIFKGFALLGAQWVMWLLLLISVVSLAIVIERLIYFWGQSEDVDAIIGEVRQRLGQSDIEGLQAWLLQRQGPAVAVALAALDSLSRGVAAVGEAASSARVRQRQKLEKLLAYLGTFGNTAPFIGLLGTVIGIVSAFHELSLSTTGGAATVMDAISEALVATAMGLLVAIPAVATYNAFHRRIKMLLGDADAVVHTILSLSHGETDAPTPRRDS